MPYKQTRNCERSLPPFLMNLRQRPFKLKNPVQKYSVLPSWLTEPTSTFLTTYTKHFITYLNHFIVRLTVRLQDN